MNGFAKHVVCVAGFCWAAIFTAGVTGTARAADWPMYKYDAARTGYTPEKLPKDLTLKWVYKAAHPPRPAWPHVGFRGPSVGPKYDFAFQPIVVGGLVLFGSSADGKLYALDAATGAERWTFFTEGPIRFAPAAWRDRVFVGSDDGYLYCLELKTGKLLWKKRGGPSNEKVLGNDFVVSRWPIRGGVAVRDDVVYFGAGVWAIDRAYLHAVDAETGKERWTTVTGGSMPDKKEGHGFAPQGYLAVGEKKLIAPNMHAPAAVFDRETGAWAYGSGSGEGATIIDAKLACIGGGFVNLETGRRIANIDQRNFICPLATVVSNCIYSSGTQGGGITGYYRGVLKQDAETKGKDKPLNLHVIKGAGFAFGVGYKYVGMALIAAGGRLYTGGRSGVAASDMETRKRVWAAEVEGGARGLAAGDGRLIASTTKGYIYCFAGGEAKKAQTLGPKREEMAADAAWDAAADEIVKQAGFSEGYCVDLGCGDGRLMQALLRRTKLYVVGVEKDAEKVKQARLRLDLAGFYGNRAVVLEADPTDTGLPKWFANLVVSGRSVEGGKAVVAGVEASRIQRPYGGVTVFGKTGAMQKNIRGPLKGAGQWTHYFADAANKDCSDDVVLKAPLKTYWYRDTEVTIPHPVAAAPLFVNGRLFVMYNRGVRAVDAYNGRTIWTRKLKGMMPYWKNWGARKVVSIGYMCADETSVYVRLDSKIVRLDSATGVTLKEYEAPAKTDRTLNAWAHIAYDNGVLYASPARFALASAGGRDKGVFSYPEAGAVMALDPETGKAKWTYTAKISIPLPSICVGGGRVYLADREFDEKIHPFKSHRPSGVGEIVALNAKTGAVLWRLAIDQSRPVLAYSAKHDVLIRTFEGWNKGGDGPTSGQLAAMRGVDGKILWEKKKVGHRSWPMIIDGMLYTQPWKRDLLTGKQQTDVRTGKPWTYERTNSKSCGQVSASRNIIAFAGRDLAYVDLVGDPKTQFCGGIRPGCLINAIPAGGLLLMPDGSPCGCAFNKAWIVLQGAE